MTITLRQKLQENRMIVGGMITYFLRPAMVKIYAKAGFDFVYIVLQRYVRLQ
jgi:2-keto-3-deoxy-L-rhamnonate aldolase RhmA